jgi:hypothetical protein
VCILPARSARGLLRTLSQTDETLPDLQQYGWRPEFGSSAVSPAAARKPLFRPSLKRHGVLAARPQHHFDKLNPQQSIALFVEAGDQGKDHE